MHTQNNPNDEETVIIACISRIHWPDKLRCDHGYYKI